MRRVTDEQGFSLIELAVIVMIIGILVGVSVASYAFTTETVHRVSCETNRRVLDGAVSIHLSSNDATALASIDELQDDVRNFDRISVCPASPSTRLRYDSFEKRVVCDYHEQ